MAYLRTLFAGLAFSALVTAMSAAQASDPSDKDNLRATRKAEARAAARTEQPGERYPTPSPEVKKLKSTIDERVSARAARRAEGAKAAKETKSGEGDGIPEHAAKVSKADRQVARKSRTAEAGRANKAGEITSKGERSY